jgi:hypothetical protein
MNIIDYIRKVRSLPIVLTKNPLHEYLSIVNLSNKYNKTFLTNEPDSCEQQEDCTEPCQEYSSSKGFMCVHPSRIRTFHDKKELGFEFLSKLTHRPFIVLDSVLYRSDLFYKIILSKDTNVVYVLFNMGRVIPKDELYSFEDMNALYLKLIHNISPNNKVVLCGHSMGAVQALRMALYLFEHHHDFFVTIQVIVTGPYKWLLPHSKFTHLPNVHVYFTGYQDKVDVFASQNDTLEHYVPYTLITLDKIQECFHQPNLFVPRDYAEPIHNILFYTKLIGKEMVGGKTKKKKRKFTRIKKK